MLEEITIEWWRSWYTKRHVYIKTLNYTLALYLVVFFLIYYHSRSIIYL